MKKRISAQAWFERARVELAKFSKSGTEDAARILEAVLQQTSSKLWAHGERQLTISEYISLEALLDKRKQGIPVAYLIGKKAFWELEFQTSPVALVPRPETEHLVFYALELLDPSKQIQLVDLGCGSGCIGLSLAYALSNAEVFCTDQ